MEAKEAQRLRRAIEAHKHAMREYKGAEYDLALWKALEETAYDEAGGQAGWSSESWRRANNRLMVEMDAANRISGSTIEGLHMANAELRELVRWRKWPDESPDSWRHYMVMTDLSWPVIAFYTGEYFRIHSDIIVGITHWRPIGPLPGGE